MPTPRFSINEEGGHFDARVLVDVRSALRRWLQLRQIAGSLAEAEELLRGDEIGDRVLAADEDRETGVQTVGGVRSVADRA